MKKKDSAKESTTKETPKDGFDVSHNEQIPAVPPQVIHPPKESTDPAESLKHA